jgi:hypothetical protein
VPGFFDWKVKPEKSPAEVNKIRNDRATGREDIRTSNERNKRKQAGRFWRKNKAVSFEKQPCKVGGRRGIRTPGTLTSTTV